MAANFCIRGVRGRKVHCDQRRFRELRLYRMLITQASNRWWGIPSKRAKFSPRVLVTERAGPFRPLLTPALRLSVFLLGEFVSVLSRPRLRSHCLVTCSSPRERHIACRTPPPPPCPRDPAYFLPARPNSLLRKPRPTQSARPANLRPHPSGLKGDPRTHVFLPVQWEQAPGREGAGRKERLRYAARKGRGL